MDNHLFVDAILWMAGNAACWRDLPEVFGKWTGVHARFRRWLHAGVWERLFHSLADTPDFEYVLIDSTISKVHADAVGAKGRNPPRFQRCAASLESGWRGLRLPGSVARVAG